MGRLGTASKNAKDDKLSIMKYMSSFKGSGIQQSSVSDLLFRGDCKESADIFQKYL